MDEQPKLADQRVAEIPVEDEDKVDPGDVKKIKEKYSYDTRAAAARQGAGLDKKSGSRKAQGVGVRTYGVIVIDNDNETVQVEVRGWMCTHCPSNLNQKISRWSQNRNPKFLAGAHARGCSELRSRPE